MTRVKATIDGAPYAVAIEAGPYRLSADEPEKLGGGATGPAPYDLLLSSLGACTAITLRMYADRKGWSLDRLSVDLRIVRHDEQVHIERVLHIEGGLDEAARARLADIAERTPVTLTLKAGAPIATTLATI